MCVCVGVSDVQSLDCELLVRENSQLREDKETMRNKEKTLTNELKKKHEEAGQQKLMETAMRCELEKVRGGHYKVR